LHTALADGGLFCFNAVDSPPGSDNKLLASHSVQQADAVIQLLALLLATMRALASSNREAAYEKTNG